MKTFLIITRAVINFPIVMYIMYSILSSINADRLLWFLFWINIPITLFVAIGLSILEKK